MCKNRDDEKTLAAMRITQPIPVGLAAYSHNYSAQPQLRTIYLQAETGSPATPRRTRGRGAPVRTAAGGNQ